MNLEGYTNLSFGSLKAPKVEEVDKFNGKAILTIHEAPTQKGSAWRLSFNQVAQELFGTTENEEYPVTALFAKKSDGGIDVFLVSSEGVAFDEKVLYLLRKNKSISSKVLYNELAEVFAIENTAKENYLELTEDVAVTTFLNERIQEEGGEGKVLKALKAIEYKVVIQAEEEVISQEEESPATEGSEVEH